MITTKINLLPWREERRKQMQQDFLVLLGVAAALAVLVWFMWQTNVNGQIETQTSRNAYIKKELTLLEEQIKEIKELEQRREELVGRMETIQSLQNDRPSIVYLFDQLVRTVPDGVHYTSIERKGKSFTITGVAESNTRISALMRALNESPWFIGPSLQTVTAIKDSEASSFTLTVRQEEQQKEESSDAANKGGQKK